MAKIKLSLDPLGARVVPSATLANGILTIDGTAGKDVIVVRQVRDQIVVKGQTIQVNGTEVRSVSAADVTRIDVSAGAGDDVINLSRVNVPTTVDAGDGNDRVRGGRGADVIHGGAGNDRLFSQAGNDDVFGGAGDDSVNGGAGDDSLQGEAGDDSVNGGAGDDNCDGGVGDDHVTGGRGRDLNQGGGGDDDVSDVDDHGGSTRVRFAGAITAIAADTGVVTVQRQTGESVDVTVTAATELQKNDRPATLADFAVGDWVKVKLDAAGNLLELEAEGRSGSDDNGGDDNGGGDVGGGGDGRTDLEGVLTAVDLTGSTVTVQQQSGETVQLTVGPDVRVERNDQHVTLADLQVGDRIEAKFDSLGVLIKLEAVGV